MLFRSKLDSCALSLNDAGRKDSAKGILSLLRLDISKTNISLLLPLLTEDILKTMEEALRGRWKTKEIKITELMDKISGRRFKYEDLCGLLAQWIGEDKQSIIHVRDDHSSSSARLKQELEKYGFPGEKLFMDIQEAAAQGVPASLEEMFEEDGKWPQFDHIPWPQFSLEELCRFLRTEKIFYLKKKLRQEILTRTGNDYLPLSKIAAVEDPFLKDLISVNNLLSQSHKYVGSEIFTSLLAPLNYFHEKLHYERSVHDFIDDHWLDKIRPHIEALEKAYQLNPDRFHQVKEVAQVREMIHGPVVILDGLRYDLWIMLKEPMNQKGWKIKEYPFKISVPSVTSHFRKVMGIEEESGHINGKSYTLFKWAEHRGNRDIKKFLNGKEDIQFLHFNFIDVKAHSSSLDLYPLYQTIKEEFVYGVLPLLEKMASFYLMSDHGFADTGRLKERYVHGKDSLWEIILPLAEVHI